MIKARPSSIATYLRCAASLAMAANGLPQTDGGAPAASGTLLHGLWAAMIQTGAIPKSFQDKDTEIVFWMGWRLWEKGGDGFAPLKSYFTGELFTELRCGVGTPTEGTCDVGSFDETASLLNILDHKSGRVDNGGDVFDQLKTYAGNVCRDRQIKPETVRLWHIFTREGRYECRDYSYTDIAAHMARINEQIKKAETLDLGNLASYTLSEGCLRCNARLHCPALAAQTLPMMTQGRETACPTKKKGDWIADLSHLTNAQLAVAIRDASAIEDYLAAFWLGVKARASVTAIPLTDGKKVYGQRPVNKSEWQPEEAMAMAKRELGRIPEGCVSFSGTALEKAVKDAAMDGEKGRAWQDFTERALAEGALIRTVGKRFVEYNPDNVKELE